MDLLFFKIGIRLGECSASCLGCFIPWGKGWAVAGWLDLIVYLDTVKKRKCAHAHAHSVAHGHLKDEIGGTIREMKVSQQIFNRTIKPFFATCWTVCRSNPGGGEIFLTRPDRSWGPPILLYIGYRVFPGGKVAGGGFDHQPPSSAEVKERVELYHYSPCGSSWPVVGWILTLSLPLPKPF